MFQKLTNYIKKLDLESLSSERKEVLNPFIEYLQEKINSGGNISLNFICTHNSRRSHLSQIWAQALAAHFQLNQVTCYSGGTAATAIYPMVIQVLEEAGFETVQLSNEGNPVYAIKYKADSHPIIAFSKTYDHAFNPSIGFAALMTCSDADENCPFIPGTEKRIALNYEDPKAFDGSPLQKSKYEERSRQIATELFYVFLKIKKS
ncbi:protein-tyrosine-phosphatase [Marivirga salinae]|uniref:Protein-tyrosine-phosphatase n=1 Tax=Marivirga salinarum TaxID=3059078 RepID=A0AA49JGV1_9BACT|nr:protein-tyrosine-phosphatase [Marivirga sp. BDSF4-3]WKK76287.2 protein-tyrosine-phosphatase [Marivirga sp. BDSF4-3]